MSRKIAVDIDLIAQTQRKLTTAASDIQSASATLSSADLPNSQLAAPFTSELSRLFELAQIAITDATSWAEKAQENVSATSQELLSVDSEAADAYSSLMSQVASRGVPGAPRRGVDR